jgi:hypothetical protein
VVIKFLPESEKQRHAGAEANRPSWHQGRRGEVVAAIRYLALNELWWVQWRDVDPVREALLAAHALHFERILQHELRKNKKKKRSPQSFHDLANLLGRDVASLFRWREGETEMSRMDVDAVADSLGLPAGSLFPQREAKIAVAASILCDYPVKTYPEIELKPLAYAAYRIAGPVPCNGELDQETMVKVAATIDARGACNGRVKDWIWEVVYKLEPKLERASFDNPRCR